MAVEVVVVVSGVDVVVSTVVVVISVADVVIISVVVVDEVVVVLVLVVALAHGFSPILNTVTSPPRSNPKSWL